MIDQREEKEEKELIYTQNCELAKGRVEDRRPTRW